MKKPLCASIATALLLSACNLVPDYRRPDVETPLQWHDKGLAGQTSAVNPQWWQAFGSAELNRLVTEALAYNYDLAAARQRVEQARAQAKIAGANLWPQLGLQGDYTFTHNTGNTQSNTGLTNSSRGGDNDRLSGQFTVAYEVDLWGANRARRDAGEARFLSEAFARDALQLLVMSDVSQAYFNLLASAELKRIASEFLQNVQNVMTIVEARFQAGAVSALDVAQQQTELATARANLDLITQQTILAENALTILLGHPPQTVPLSTEGFFDMRLPGISPLQPAALLERRPDVRQVEMEMIAANADIGVARAAFYPRLQLNLDAILASPQPAGVALAMASSLAQPLFQGGRLEGELENAKAVNAELVEIYRNTVLTAFKEVEDAAAVRSNASRRLEALAEAVEQARLAYQLSLDRYRLGAIDYQALLLTQRSLLTAENSQVQARLDVLVAMVQLYQALGGGWMAADSGEWKIGARD